MGRGRAATPPTNSMQATTRIGMLGLTSTNAPKISVPKIAPILPISRWIPAAVALMKNKTII